MQKVKELRIKEMVHLLNNYTGLKERKNLKGIKDEVAAVSLEVVIKEQGMGFIGKALSLNLIYTPYAMKVCHGYNKIALSFCRNFYEDINRIYQEECSLEVLDEACQQCADLGISYSTGSVASMSLEKVVEDTGCMGAPHEPEVSQDMEVSEDSVGSQDIAVNKVSENSQVTEVDQGVEAAQNADEVQELEDSETIDSCSSESVGDKTVEIVLSSEDASLLNRLYGVSVLGVNALDFEGLKLPAWGQQASISEENEFEVYPEESEDSQVEGSVKWNPDELPTAEVESKEIFSDLDEEVSFESDEAPLEEESDEDFLNDESAEDSDIDFELDKGEVLEGAPPTMATNCNPHRRTSKKSKEVDLEGVEGLWDVYENLDKKDPRRALTERTKVSTAGSRSIELSKVNAMIIYIIDLEGDIVANDFLEIVPDARKLAKAHLEAAKQNLTKIASKMVREITF